MKAFITYEGLPLNSGGAHQLPAKPLTEVCASMLNFLQLYTDTQGADRVRVQLVDFSFRNIIKYSLRFGFPSFDWNNYLANGIKDTYWNVYLRKIEYYVDQIVSHRELGLSVYWRFNFIDPRTRRVLPGQSELPVLDARLENSRVYLWLSATKSTASVWFAFPFDHLTDDNLKYIEGIQETLPFKFSKRFWRLWNKSDNGKWIPKKI
ncbi:hypothetical protein CPT03_03660 [Pedobacter ginsengisoli]|uniref:Uncharacterized protein n=2 Tax=Pedobacter ginsengisoli TaxID=363852 RepID=A0A2D1U1Z0_9SPHI|nr:hypothetical protein CPT03_03660 [Pedobacter ginsengisoli]